MMERVEYIPKNGGSTRRPANRSSRPLSASATRGSTVMKVAIRRPYSASGIRNREIMTTQTLKRAKPITSSTISSHHVVNTYTGPAGGAITKVDEPNISLIRRPFSSATIRSVRPRLNSAMSTIFKLRKDQAQVLLKMPRAERYENLLELGWDDRCCTSTCGNSRILHRQEPCFDSSRSHARLLEPRNSRSTPALARLEIDPACKRVVDSRFARDVRRVEELWAELQVPSRDRDFFRVVYMTGPVSHGNAIMVAEQLNLLEDHRDACINVLTAVATRRAAASKLTRIIDRCSSISDSVDAEPGRTLRQEITQACRSLRRCTLEVVETITAWRSNLWRPEPFLYEGENVITTLLRDMDLLTEPRGRLAAWLGVKFQDPALLIPARGEESMQVSAASRSRLEAAALIMRSESELQRSLADESVKLQDLGFYIPSLKWTPNEHAMQIWADHAAAVTLEGSGLAMPADDTTGTSRLARACTSDAVKREELFSGRVKLPPLGHSHKINVFEGEGGLLFHVVDPKSNCEGKIVVDIRSTELPSRLRSPDARLELIRSLLLRLQTNPDSADNAGILRLYFGSLRGLASKASQSRPSNNRDARLAFEREALKSNMLQERAALAEAVAKESAGKAEWRKGVADRLRAKKAAIARLRQVREEEGLVASSEI